MAFENGHALVIGVGTYEHIPAADVPVTVADAQEVAAVLRDPNLCGYAAERVTLLHDDIATRARLLDALDMLAGEASAENTVLLYYSGHGEYGTDGNYYLTTHDTRVSGNRVVKETGISEIELLDRLRAIPSRRLLLLFNACHSGEISPNLGAGDEEKAFGAVSPPAKTTDAILSSGEGRIIITACRPEQKSWIGTGKLTIFTQALVDGLGGKGYVPNNSGYVSAFALYEHLYLSVKDTAGKMGKLQEPELTVLRGVGPFPVSLYKGASDLGMFDTQELLPDEMATREIDPQLSKHLFERMLGQITIESRVTIASRERAVAVGGDVSGSTIITGDQNKVER